MTQLYFAPPFNQEASQSKTMRDITQDRISEEDMNMMMSQSSGLGQSKLGTTKQLEELNEEEKREDRFR